MKEHDNETAQTEQENTQLKKQLKKIHQLSKVTDPNKRVILRPRKDGIPHVRR